MEDKIVLRIDAGIGVVNRNMVMYTKEAVLNSLSSYIGKTIGTPTGQSLIVESATLDELNNQIVLVTRKAIARIPYGQEKRFGAIDFGKCCPDCDTEVGCMHKNGCDIEECSVCGLQKIDCECEGKKC